MWRRGAILLGCIVGLSCASSDGGPVGSGISSLSAISGNIVDVQTDAGTTESRRTQAALPAIQVSIDGRPTLTTTADRSGNFELSGTFSGAVVVRFTVPDFQVTQALDVPAGSAVVLQDVELQPDGVVVQAARQLDFFGVVDLVDCSGHTLLVSQRTSDGMQFLIHLNTQTNFVDAAGDAQDCASIQAGDTVVVEGSIAYATDRTITALAVTIAPLAPPATRPERTARFAGAIATLDCTAGLLVVDDSAQRTTIRLTSQTRLTSGAGGLACKDLALGDAVRGEGQVDLRMPGVIVASALVVTGPPSAGQTLRFVGFVIGVDCTSGALQLRDDQTTIALQLSPATVIAGRAGQPLTCADIDADERVEGLGEIAPDAPGTLDALRLTLGPAKLGPPP
jgi:hypothetical protein